MTAIGDPPVALDLMGGDLGPDPLLDGAVRAIVDDDAHVVAVGRPELQSRIERNHGQLIASGRLAFVAALEVVTMDDPPAQAARRKQRSSMRTACDLVRQGRCSSVVSTGNSGAFAATASFVLGRLDGVLRPAIGAFFPSTARDGHTLLLDAGAQVECTALHLAQWGVLGSAYLSCLTGQEHPRVGVLSNGEEAHKGTTLTRGALALLRQTDVVVHGPCEGRDLFQSGLDVVVTDGFTGNIVLKTAEGVVSFLGGLVRDTFARGSIVDRLGGVLSQAGWQRLRTRLDPREVGAAPLLGLRSPAFVAHGRSDAHAIRCSIRSARRFARLDVARALSAAIERNHAVHPPRGQARHAPLTSFATREPTPSDAPATSDEDDD
jgi:glycerol-3-phosphate acyltransferase PlsX